MIKDHFNRPLFKGDRVKFIDGDKGFIRETRNVTDRRIKVTLDDDFILEGWVCEEFAFKINYL